MRHSCWLLAATTAAVIGWLPACGGGQNGGRSPAPGPQPTPQPSNPCLSAAALDSPEPLAEEPREPSRKRPKGRPVLDRSGDLLGQFWDHEAARRRRAPLEGVPTASADVGDIAVLQDAGDLIAPPNRFDLRSTGLRFTPSGSGYTVGRADAAFRSRLGTGVTLQDDDARAFDLPFGFAFFGANESRAFVNSDGNVTFGQSDTASTDRNITRLLTGPPRVAPFFADLDPSAGTGRVFVDSAADAFTVTWCDVRAFDSTDTVTVQASLLPDGGVEVRFGDAIDVASAIVGLSPGHADAFDPIDLSAGASSQTREAVGERFADAPSIDLVSTARRFYQGHGDRYDQLVIWTDQRVVTDAFAFETTVANEIRGLGIDVYDQASAFGSAGRLRSLVMMDTIDKYPADPQQRFLGENSTVSVLGQEVGHRWLAYLKFRDADGRTSDALLGRDQAHWSFFMDTDASVMEGNDIEDLGGGRFRTVGAVSRYSRLDQYAMGLVGESDVPPFFYVEAPANVQPPHEAADDPDIGVTFDGTRRDVLIGDIVAVMGRRQPSSRQSPRVLRQAFVLVLSGGQSVDSARTGHVDRIRRAWETFFSRAVGGRMRAETRLEPPS